MIGNYSLADQLAGVGLTPLGEDVLNDPRAMQRMGNDLAGMSAYQPQGGVLLDAEPAGAVYGQQGSSFFSATPEDDTNVVVKAIQTVLGAPFNLLRAGKEGLEEVIGHPYAAQREMQDDRAEMIAHMLADSDKAMVGMPFDRGGINARQTNTSTVATGQATGIQPVLTPRKTGIVELFTGENRKRRAREMMALQEAMKLRGVQLDWNKTGSEILKNNMGAYQSYQAGEKDRIGNVEIPANNQAWRRTQDTQSEQNLAAAGAQRSLSGKYGAEAGLANARADKERALTPAEVYRTYQQGNRAAAGADKDWSIAGTNEARRPSLLDYDAARVETERSKAVRNYGSTAATLGKMQNDGEVATGVKREVEFDKQTGGLKKQASNLLSGNISGGQAQSVEDVSNWLGVPMKTTDTWWPFDETTSLDWDAYVEKNKPAAGVVKKAEEKSVWEALSNLRAMVEEATKKAETGAKPVPTTADPAQPTMPEPTINPVTIDDYDKVVPQLAKTSEVRDFLIQKYGLAETQAREVARALYYRRGGK